MTSVAERPIRRLLVANRAEIASRVFRTAHAMGIECVAVYSTADEAAAYVGQADLAVHLPGSASVDTYLNQAAIIDAARRTQADAIHPGYGFLSENPDFAQVVIDAGLTWVGPTPASIRAMALKVQAKQTAAAVGVPLARSASLPDDLDDAGLIQAGAEVGYPLLVKASAGGGGKGMRIVHDPVDLVEAVAAARREAMSAFGDATVFAERYLVGARHVEVQVFGDLHGNLVHCFERECSVQRRHQKVIEEAPSPGITEVTRTGLLRCATDLARAIDYVGAGTVEFLVFGSGVEQEFCFLEMNTRLQVEHPVTEAITGIDLVAWQLLIAQGHELPLNQGQITAHGHAIQARIYAEDPARGFMPAPGRLDCFGGIGEDIRLDTSVADGSVVTAHYDPMLAKVIAHGPTRSTARAKLVRALRGMRIHGVVSNRQSLIATIEHPVFADGAATTSFLDEYPQVLDPQPDPMAMDRHLLAATFAWSSWLTGDDEGASVVPPGWRNVPAVPQICSWQRRGDDQVITVRYRRTAEGLDIDLLGTQGAPGAEVFTEPGRPLRNAVIHLRTQRIDRGRVHTTVDVEIDGVRARHEVCQSTQSAITSYVDDPLVSSTWTLIPRLASEQRDQASHHPVTPVPGTISAVSVQPGEVVEEGQTLVLLEAMKMEHRICAGSAGRITRILVQTGDAVDAHQVVVEIEDVGDE